MKKTLVISAFPGCGKTYFFNNFKNFLVSDSDSSNFSWIKDSEGNNTTQRNPEFPKNYIDHIKNNIGVYDIIFVSSHNVVVEALKNNNIDFTIVYPDIELKEDFLERYKNRGNNESFIKFISEHFEEFVKAIDDDVSLNKIKLTKEKRFLKDVISK